MKRFLLLAAGLMFTSGACLAQTVYEATTNPVRISFKIDDKQAPDVFLTYRNGAAINVLGKVEVEIMVVDEWGIKNVSINSREIATNSKDTIVFAQEFNPDQEVNVVARDNSGNVREKSFIVRSSSVTNVAINDGPVSRRYKALIIATNDYSDPKIASLNEPIKDALLLQDVLLSSYTFEKENIKFVRNPTFEEMNVAFEDLTREVTSGDFLLIFYAGHGYFDDRTNIGYWLPSDAQNENRSKWFRNSALVENIAAINSKHTLLIADACFSGQIFKTRAAFNNASPDIGDLMKRPSRKAMTSGSLTTVPDQSVFMRYLLQSLRENQNKYLPSEDLFETIRIAMRSNANTRPLYGEVQNVGDEGGNFVFIRK